MNWKDYPIFQRDDKSFVIVINEAPYHVPNESEWAELHAEVAKFYANNESARSEYEFQYIDLHPELLPPEPTFEEVRAAALSRIDSATSAAILAGFEYEVEGEALHFSYDSFDQQNFADTANAAMLAMQGVEGVPQTVTWNGWRNHNAESKGELVRLTLDVQTFLALYTGGALVHKATQMEIGGQRKAAIEAAETVEEINNLLEEWEV